MKSFLAFLLLSLAAGAGCAADAPALPGQPASGVIAADQSSVASYRLGSADKVRLLVYNEPTLSGEFQVSSVGTLSVPLIGDVAAAGKTVAEVRSDITARLADGYLVNPRVSIEIITLRPYYILGEVNKPGQYLYSPGLTVLNAVATAEGFTHRANKRRVFIKRAESKEEQSVPLSSSTTVEPGDTIRIGERYF